MAILGSERLMSLTANPPKLALPLRTQICEIDDQSSSQTGTASRRKGRSKAFMGKGGIKSGGVLRARPR